MGADAGVALAWLRRHVSKRAWRDAVTEPQAQGHTVFHKAAQRGRREAISRLLMEFEDDADALMMPLSPRTTRGGLPQKSRRPRGTTTRRRSWRGPRRQLWSRGVRARSGGRCGGARPRSRAFWSVSRRCGVFVARFL